MEFFVIEIVKNTQGQYAPISGVVKSDLNSAMVYYHQKMATFMNAADVAYAEILVKNSAGGTHVDDVFKREPEPQPEPEPEPESETESE